MAERAQVTSVEALETFRAQLIVYMSKARATLEEASGEVQRTQAWLENDRRNHWDRECRRRSQVLEEAQQEFFSSRLSTFRTHSAAQVLAVERARRSLTQAQEKRDAVRRWTREFENRAAPLVNHVDQLLNFVTTDLVKSVAQLGSFVSILHSYATLQGGGATATGNVLSSRAQGLPVAEASTPPAEAAEQPEGGAT